MTNHIYRHSTGVIFRVDTGIDLDGATSTSIIIKGPKQTNEVTATIYDSSNGILQRIIQAGDIDFDFGIYTLQSKVIFSGNTFYGDAVKFKVLNIGEVP